MKKFFLIMLIAMAGGITASAQKFALVDMEYIMKKIFFETGPMSRFSTS